MPKCKKCGVEITALVEDLRNLRYVEIVEVGRVLIDTPFAVDVEGYECPECNEVLFDTLEEAEKFLKNEE